MENIPTLKFKKNQHAIGFEAIKMSRIIARRDQLDHRIEVGHRIKFYFIFLVTKGEGIHRIDFQPVAYAPGSVLIVSKEQVHALDKRFQSEGIVILFTEQFLTKNVIQSDILFLHRLFNYHLHVPIIHPEEYESEDLAHIFHEIYNEYHSPDNYAKEELLRAQLKILLLKAERIKRSFISVEHRPRWIDLFTQLKTLIAAHHTKTRNAKDYANRLNISYKHLNQICKTATGNTAKQFIDACLILEIKRQLAISNQSVKALTYGFGFDEPTNFLKFFKKHTGQTPVQFRRELSL